MAALYETLGILDNNEATESLVEPTPSERNNLEFQLKMNIPHIQITEVQKVKNTYLTCMYQLKKQEYISRYEGAFIKEMNLFHATSPSHVDSIIQDNLDWRRVRRGKFGVGVSFSNDPAYANKYCNNNIRSSRAFIVAKVLVYNLHKGSYAVKVPNTGYDTTVGNHNKVFVKFNDNEFMPEYVVYYNV